MPLNVGDFDRDRDVDFADFAELQGCVTCVGSVDVFYWRSLLSEIGVRVGGTECVEARESPGELKEGVKFYD